MRLKASQPSAHSCLKVVIPGLYSRLFRVILGFGEIRRPCALRAPRGALPVSLLVDSYSLLTSASFEQF